VKPVLRPAVFRHPTTSSLVGVPFAAPPSANDTPPPSSLSPPQPAIASVTIATVHEARFTLKVIGEWSHPPAGKPVPTRRGENRAPIPLIARGRPQARRTSR